MGTVGFALNGVPIFNPYDSKCCDAGTYELTVRDTLTTSLESEVQTFWFGPRIHVLGYPWFKL